ncbi:hypothetical protein [Cumulibacter soli]|uniref:hypothetical protein n=1 Tax=Cumulibacter soli TaxID=2546344 RepID=UPI001067D314|nr:hypothetical protein [Cumulibacter soli]
MTTPNTRRRKWLRVTRWQLSAAIRIMTWGWALAIVVVAIALTIIAQFADVTQSAFAYSHQGLLWFPFSIALAFAIAYLPIHVASGMTRASFIKSTIITSVLTGLANTAFSMLALLAERAIYHQLGWFHGATDEDGGDIFAGGIWNYAVALALLFVGGMLSGSLTGLAYYRFSGWATFLLPLTLLPILGMLMFGFSDADQWTPWGTEIFGTWQGGTFVGLAVLVAACIAIAALTRRIPIDTKKG